MAHRPETAAGIYDVHGDYHASTRLRGHATIIRQRQRLAASAEPDEDSGGTPSASVADSGDAGTAVDDSEGGVPASGSVAASPSGTAAADSTTYDAPDRTRSVARHAAPGRQEAADGGRQVWTATETQVLTAAMRDFLIGQKTRYDIRDLNASDREALARFTTKPIYDKSKYLKMCLKK